MSAITKELKLTQRAPKKPVKNLPPSVPITSTTTVEDVKLAVAKAAGIRQHHRIGVYDPSTRTTLKNRKAKIVDIPSVLEAGEVLIKDMGAQLEWRTVFIIEYLGPVIIHPLIMLLLPYLPFGYAQPLNQTQKLSFWLVFLHFVKRELETMFVHKFSAATMPIANVFWNSLFYWVPAGLIAALEIYSPWGLAARPDIPAMNAVGVVIYLFGQIMNARVHLYLSSLRKPGETERRLPSGYGFDMVTCPNYMYEVIAWAGIILITRSVSLLVFIAIGIKWMWTWGEEKEAAYRKQFGDKYKKKQYVMLPGLF